MLTDRGTEYCGNPERHEYELYLAVEDIDRSIDFYHNTLGFAVVGRAEAEGRLFWCRVERGGASIMLQQADEETDGYSICFESPTETWAG